MNNYKIIIDASHGGEDVGLLLHNIPEKNLTLEISKYMYQKFRDLNVSAMLTREQDETIFPQNRVKKITEAYGDHKYVIVISNHICDHNEYEVVYGIDHTSHLSNRISSYLIQNEENVICHSKRLGFNSHLDYYAIHRSVANMEVIRISHPFTQNRGNLDKNVDQIVKAVYEYIGGYVEKDISYQVEKGDTLWKVAKKFNLSVDELKWLNGFSDNLLRTGDVIKVKNEKQERSYLIGSGENLYQIAKKFEISLEDLMRYNHMKSNFVQIGETIKIPNVEIEHSVRKGENLYQIADYYQSDVSDLIENNHLEGKKIETGDVITI